MDSIPLFRVAMSPFAAEDVGKVLSSGWIGQGPKVEEFEDALTPYMGRRPITTSSGTAAITIGLRLAGVGPDTYVITTPMTCSATNIPILNLGAHPIWADVDPVTGLIDPGSVERALKTAKRNGQSVRAIIAVDWGGQPCNYRDLMAVAYGIPVLADAAHSFGATAVNGDPVGSLATMTAFSFQAIKTLTTGDGGALTVPDEWVHRAKDMRWFGIDREAEGYDFRGEQDIIEWGFKAHMNDIAATIGLSNIGLAEMNLATQRVARALYDERLVPEFGRTGYPSHGIGAWWLYTTLLPGAVARDKFVGYMKRMHVAVSRVHWRSDRLSIFRPYQRVLPGVDEFSDRMVCLPTHSGAPANIVASIANSFFDA